MITDKSLSEAQTQPSCLGAVISSFNTKSKRMVKVISGDEVGDFENQMFNQAQKFNSITKVQLTTSAPILAMQC